MKSFRASIQVTGQLMREATDELLNAEITDRLFAQLSGPLTGPRGGRYEPIGDIEYLGSAQVDEDFVRNVWTFVARRQGKYVRPRRDAANRLGEALG